VESPVAYPIRVCSICSEEFELRPDKPGFANRCPGCSEQGEATAKTSGTDESARESDRQLDEARRKAMRDLLYRKDS
jgi:hypothetical protein